MYKQTVCRKVIALKQQGSAVHNNPRHTDNRMRVQHCYYSSGTVRDVSVLGWTPGCRHEADIAFSSLPCTWVVFVGLVHHHRRGVPVDDVQEEVGRIVVGLALVACSDSVTSAKWQLGDGQEARTPARGMRSAAEPQPAECLLNLTPCFVWLTRAQEQLIRSQPYHPKHIQVKRWNPKRNTQPVKSWTC